MKKHLLPLCVTLFLIFAGGMTAGCDKLDDKYKSEKTVTLTIASVKPAAADDDYDWLQGLPVLLLVPFEAPYACQRYSVYAVPAFLSVPTVWTAVPAPCHA